MSHEPSAGSITGSTAEPVILFNETHLPWRNALSVADVLIQQGVEGQAVATAVNGSFVPRGQREHTPLQPGDALTVFKAIVGG